MMANDRQKRAIAVILSGFDSDGAAALKSIKEAGGLVFAQKFQTAQQPDMPQSAVKTGCVDRLLSPPRSLSNWDASARNGLGSRIETRVRLTGLPWFDLR
jgi:chemotaxis response regulator CheB